MNKTLYKYGYAVYILMLAMAIVFYKERTIFIDIAYHLYSIIVNNDFAFQAHRYGAVFTQAFPVIGSKLSLSLDTIMLLYSGGTMLYYIACYWVCGTVLKQYELALGVLLLNILFVSKTFYWMQAELPQGCAFMFVMFALLKSTRLAKNDIVKLIFLVPVIILAVCFHPIIWIPAVFVVVYFSLSHEQLADKRIFFIGSLLFFILFYIKTKLFVNPYDAHAMKQSDKMWELFPNWVNLTSNRRFLKYCMNSFIWIPISFLFISTVYFIKRKRLLLLTVPAFFGAYILLVNTTYPHGNEPIFYMENLYLPIAVIFALPLAYDVIPALQKFYAGYILIALIAITGLIRIYNTHRAYTDRISWLRGFMAEHSGQKLMIEETPEYIDKLIMTWGTSFEFWLLSTTETGQTESIIITDNIDKLFYDHWERKYFVTPFTAAPYIHLPGKYFKLTDTTTHYKIIR